MNDLSYFHVESDLVDEAASQKWPASRLLVMLHLCRCCFGSYGARNTAFPAVSTIARALHMDERTVRTALAWLRRRHDLPPWIARAGTRGNGVIEWVLVRRPKGLVRKGDKLPGVAKSPGDGETTRGGMAKSPGGGGEMAQRADGETATQKKQKLEQENRELELKNAGGGNNLSVPELEKLRDEGEISGAEYASLLSVELAKRRRDPPPKGP